MQQRPNVLTIAGFDPSAGAGLLADIKTLEQCNTYGMSIITANTMQTEANFVANHWINPEQIMNQLELLLQHYAFKAVKIGIIQSASLLFHVVTKIRHFDSTVPIIWDPVLSASAGFAFHKQLHLHELQDILHHITLVTPNIPEARSLFGTSLPMDTASRYGCAILLKGGHSSGEKITDTLYCNEKEEHFTHTRHPYKKHGTGCVLSSAIAAAMASGDTLNRACIKAQNYVRNFIASSNSLLGFHQSENDN